VTKPKWWSRRKYTAWYNPLYPIREALWEHVDPSARHLRPYIDSLKESILVEGMHNPLLVTIQDGITRIHPGKCRATACLELGWEKVPAVVVDYNRDASSDVVPAGCMFLDDMDEVQSLFSGDAVVEMSHRWLTIKKKRDN